MVTSPRRAWRYRAPRRWSTSPPAPEPTPASSVSRPRAGSPPSCARRVEARNFQLDDAVKDLQIKISGCFNSCGQHHVADIGFYGVSRKVGNRTVPHFQVILGGQTERNAAAYGLATLAVPSKAIPDAVERLCGLYVREREKGERFQVFITRVGKARVRELLEDLTRVPAYADDSSYYSDWGDPREYTIGDIGVGECAGEVVSLVEFGLAASERIAFEALDDLEGGKPETAAAKALRAMMQAAKAVTQIQNIDVGDDPAQIVGEFKTRFHDTGLFHDPFAGPKFAQLLLPRLRRAARAGDPGGGAPAHRRGAALHRGGARALQSDDWPTVGVMIADVVKIDLKVLAAARSPLPLERAIPVFHRWIQERSLDELMVDVADYTHVPEGPGVVLVCHDAIYSLDSGGGALGLLYSRRRETHASLGPIASLDDRLASVFRRALVACGKLERDLAGLSFPADRFELAINDRRLSAADGGELARALERLAASLFAGEQPRIEVTGGDAGARLGATLRRDRSRGVAELLSRLEVGAAARVS